MNAYILLFKLLSFLSRLISGLFANWKLVLIVALVVLPISPHLRWEYTYIGDSHNRRYIRCTYLGSRGFVTPKYIEGCPFITILNAETGRTPW